MHVVLDIKFSPSQLDTSDVRWTFVTYFNILLLAAAAAPEVYTVIPPQPSEKKPGQLEQWQLEEFFDKGFVQVNKFFTKDELQPVIKVRE